MDFDAVLIEESIAKQYHILPSEQQELSYSDWSKLVSGIMDDTPLGRIIAIRIEDDGEIIKKMTPEQLSIRDEWFAFKAKNIINDINTMRRQADDLEKMMALNFG